MQQRSDGWVVLGVDEYRALRERASPQPPRPDARPIDATLTRIDYDLRVDGDTIAGRALLAIDALREGWTRVETETIRVSGASPIEPVPPSLTTLSATRALDKDEKRADEPKLVAPSSNVVNLQRRTARVLPIGLDVPKAGTSLRFVKPLVVDQEVNVTLRYKRRG